MEWPAFLGYPERAKGEKARGRQREVLAPWILKSVFWYFFDLGAFWGSLPPWKKVPSGKISMDSQNIYCMLPVSPVFHTVETVRLGLKAH